MSTQSPIYFRRFSLLEMLATVIVMAILMSFAAPAVSKALQGSSVDITAKEIGSQLHLARQYALANRRYVAVILPGANSNVHQEYQYTCSRLAFVVRDNNNWNFDSWVGSSTWKYTRSSVAIMEADADVGINNAGSDGSFSLTPADNNYTQIMNVDLSKLGSSIATDGVRGIVYSPAGRVKGQALFITVGEAVYSGSNWTIKNPVPTGEMTTNESCRNQITIEVNRFTGGTFYWTPEQY